MKEFLKSNQLTYIKERQCYAFCTIFFITHDGEMGESKILLIFNEQGEFIKTESYLNDQLQHEPIKEREKREKEEIKIAMKQKETMENILKKLILPQNKKEIKIIEDGIETYENSDKKNLSIEFEIESLKFWYYIGIDNSQNDDLHIMYKEQARPWKEAITALKHIPSLKGIKECIRKHPKIRVKYVNEILCYEKNRL